jgi:hypothetical protein
MRTNGLHDGSTFADHSESVLATVEEFIDRAREIRELRSFEGRALSQKNVGRLVAHADALGAMGDEIRAMCAESGPQQNSANLAPLMIDIEGILSRCGLRAGGN